MKKILLTSLMVVALLCVLAIAVFAEDIVVSKTESVEYGTVIQLNADPGLDNAAQYVSTLNKIADAGTDTDALCILTDGNTDNPSYYVFPSSYIVDEREDGVFDLIATQLAAAMAEFNTANGTSYYAGYETTGSGGAKRINAVVRFVFPSSVTGANASVCCMRENPKLVEVRINQAIDFSKAEKMFYRNTKLAAVIGFELVDGTKLSKTMFASCSALRYIKLPTNIVAIPGSFFQGAIGVNIVNMAELTRLTTISSWAFDGTKSLTITLPDSVTTLETSAFESAFSDGGSITINPTSQLKTIGYKAFRASSKLNSFYIPSTVISIGDYAFESCGAKVFENFENCQITKLGNSVFLSAAVETIKIPSTVTEIGAAFSKNSNLKLVYIPDTVTTIADTFTSSAENIVFLYIGKDASVLSNCTRIAGATVISASEYNEANTYTGVNLVLGYSNCIAYNNGVHGESVVDIVVTTYLEDIKIVSKCVLCEMTDETDRISAIFTCLGYSASQGNVAGIVIGFKSNAQSIERYEEIAGKTVKYGVFAVLEDKLGENDVFDANGNAANGVIGAELSDSKFAMFDLKIIGFTEEQMDARLALGAYVAVTKDGVTEYSYLQNSAPVSGGKYSFASYNEIINSLN